MAYSQSAGYGAAILHKVSNLLPTFGRVFVVMNSNDSSKYGYQMLQDVFRADTDGQVRFYTDLATAYGAAQSNNNDVIALDANTSHKVTSMLTISKNRVHFIGFDGGGHIEDQRSLISNTSTGAATDTAMVKVTGTGCSFRNIKFANNWTVAQNLYCVDDQGSQCVFENCTIQNLGSAHLTNANAASLRLSSDTTYYKNCTIGQDTLKVTSTAGQQMLVKIATTAAKRVTFENCVWQAYTNDTTHAMIRVAADGDIDRYIRLIRPSFLNFNFDASNGGALMAIAIATPSGLVSGGLIVEDPRLLFCTKLATAAVGNAGVYVTSNVNGTAASAGAVKATT